MCSDHFTSGQFSLLSQPRSQTRWRNFPSPFLWTARLMLMLAHILFLATCRKSKQGAEKAGREADKTRSAICRRRSAAEETPRSVGPVVLGDGKQKKTNPHRCDDEADYEDEEVDPRIQGELERLNQSSGDINRCETAMEDARQKFRSVLVEATVKLDELLNKIGKPVDESKPYWEARRLARQAQLEAQKAAQNFQRSSEVLRAAKETISLAEQCILDEGRRHFDSAWQEMLNHATQQVMEAELEKARSELAHKETAANHAAAIARLKQLEKKLKRAISKSKPYFEMKAKFYLQLENLKKTVDERQAELSRAKAEYKAALGNLEAISGEIHERRRSSVVGPRGRGVGADGDCRGGPCDQSSDGISVMSVCFDDAGAASEEDSETRSTCSRGSSPSSPQDLVSPCSFASSSSSSCPSPTPSSSSSSSSPPSRPCSLDLPVSVSLSDFGLISPVLGPRSECSGASSPECDLERGERAEGAEVPPDNGPAAVNNNNNGCAPPAPKRVFNLEARFSFLNLRRQRGDFSQKAVVVKGL
ncbi:SH3 domain-binding protein 5b isoform X2 [Syngnathoides biaculeatus]|uniref:SH3 domain-binding protein 5b isoform X2 n=1 Tax=Syngnathoides biaculeatus TaxID=300417 RepID=UPI002ADD801D|nr:SH3 domain-binding protein 5b isoform X2 [Syngnathoides biaculeatus]